MTPWPQLLTQNGTTAISTRCILRDPSNQNLFWPFQTPVSVAHQWQSCVIGPFPASLPTVNPHASVLASYLHERAWCKSPGVRLPKSGAWSRLRPPRCLPPSCKEQWGWMTWTAQSPERKKIQVKLIQDDTSYKYKYFCIHRSLEEHTSHW